jgi:hypothetical protein
MQPKPQGRGYQLVSIDEAQDIRSETPLLDALIDDAQQSWERKQMPLPAIKKSVKEAIDRFDQRMAAAFYQATLPALPVPHADPDREWCNVCQCYHKRA